MKFKYWTNSWQMHNAVRILFTPLCIFVSVPSLLYLFDGFLRWLVTWGWFPLMGACNLRLCFAALPANYRVKFSFEFMNQNNLSHIAFLRSRVSFFQPLFHQKEESGFSCHENVNATEQEKKGRIIWQTMETNVTKKIQNYNIFR